ncbi:MAG: hypothetical protein PHZ12_06190 [Paludibacter sp.]|nr:hypothetical protein [Paludibacter sp.]
MSEKTDIIKMINPETNISQANNDRIWMPIKKGERYPYDDVKKNNSVIYANQSLMSEDGTIQIPTDKVLIQIRDGYKLEEILKILGIKYENYNHYWDN